VAIAAGENERGEVRVRDGALTSVRRRPRAALELNTGATVDGQPLQTMSASDIAREGLRWSDAPADAQLLAPALAERVGRGRRRRVLGSVALLSGALALLAWSANHWRDAELATLRAQATALNERAAPALFATTRVSRAREELTVLAASERQRTAPDAPLHVLAQLSRVLPRDAFVQRLDWDGEQWRVDGTADDAPRLVPLLDADAHFRDVRIAAPSQRFRDAGRQRASFAIGFHMRASGGGTNGTP
jgi:Tfp pilus assembly protein PilN